MLRLPRIIDSKLQSKFKQYATHIHVDRAFARRVLCIILVLCLFTASTPAAPRGIVEGSQHLHAEISFWLKANYVIPKLWNLITLQNKKPKPEESQSDRDAKVKRLEILPGDVTVQEGQQVNFTAVAYDEENNAVGGVKINWSAHDEDRNRKADATPRGLFTARANGNFKVMAEAAGQTASVKVKVVEGKRPKKDEKPIEVKTSSSRDLPPEEVAKLQKDKSKSSAPRSSGAGRVSGMKLAHAAKAANNSVRLRRPISSLPSGALETTGRQTTLGTRAAIRRQRRQTVAPAAVTSKWRRRWRAWRDEVWIFPWRSHTTRVCGIRPAATSTTTSIAIGPPQVGRSALGRSSAWVFIKAP